MVDLLLGDDAQKEASLINTNATLAGLVRIQFFKLKLLLLDLFYFCFSNKDENNAVLAPSLVTFIRPCQATSNKLSDQHLKDE